MRVEPLPKYRRVARLILVFDAQSGATGAFVDSVRKIFMIGGCPLCSITHGVAGEKSEWTSCKQALGTPVDYVHRDEMTPAIVAATGGKLPAVLADAEGGLELLLGPEVLERCRGKVTEFRGRLMLHASMKALLLPVDPGGPGGRS